MRRACTSHIAAVVVYARGAVVTRTVEAPPVDAGTVDLVVPGITALSEPGTFRARVSGEGWRVLSVQSSPEVPGEGARPAASEEKTRAIKARLDRAQAELTHLGRRRDRLAALSIAPGLMPRSRTQAVGPRIDDALAAHALIGEATAALDARIGALEKQREALQEALHAEEVAATWATADEKRPGGEATRTVVVRLTGAGPLGGVELDYAVAAARWWPVYTLDIAGAGATLWIEGLVAQHTGEDWEGVALSLATADLLTDARLPELHSLRYGKAQPPKRAGYRPPPSGLDQLFAGYDAVFGVSITVRTTTEVRVTAVAAAKAKPAPMAPSVQRELESHRSLARPADELEAADGAASEGAPGAMPMSYEEPVLELGAAAPPPALARMQSAAMAEMPSVSMPSMSPPRSRGMFGGGGGGPPAPKVAREESPAVEEVFGGEAVDGGPDEAWLDFDRLQLPGPTDRRRRGRLQPSVDDPGARARVEARAKIGQLDAGPQALDVVESRGHFDYRWDARGAARVPADGRAHRLRLVSFGARPRYRYWTVPRETADVFREVSLDNPTPGPLLDGPVDVYVEGSLLTNSKLSRVDRGGVLRVGLGVEDRLRVARNALVTEDTAGLLGGSTAVDHQVTIELASSLGSATTVEVYDRVPVTDDKGLEVKVVSESPASEPYKQVDRGAPIKGGLLWKVSLEAGAKREVRLHYRLTLSSKSEVVGGNRRD